MFRKTIIMLFVAISVTFAISTPASASTSYPRPKAPMLIGYPEEVQVDGDFVKDAKHYTIKLSTSKKMTKPTVQRYDSNREWDSTYGVIFSGLKFNTRYYVTVEVSDANGKRISKVSKVTSVKTKKSYTENYND